MARPLLRSVGFGCAEGFLKLVRVERPGSGRAEAGERGRGASCRASFERLPVDQRKGETRREGVTGADRVTRRERMRDPPDPVFVQADRAVGAERHDHVLGSRACSSCGRLEDVPFAAELAAERLLELAAVELGDQRGLVLRGPHGRARASTMTGTRWRFAFWQRFASDCWGCRAAGCRRSRPCSACASRGRRSAARSRSTRLSVICGPASSKAVAVPSFVVTVTVWRVARATGKSAD